jgi:tRNA pseudouridine38-40 synthase
MSEPAGMTGGFSRFRIDLGYDGTDFQGWAKQPGLRTVQSELVAALEKIFGPTDNDFAMRVGGRTDAGVHALGQVCHFDVSADQLKRLGRTPLGAPRLQSLVPSDIIIYEVSRAYQGFDARFSAIGRSYRYLITDAKSPRSPLSTRYELSLHDELDVTEMKKAAKKLVGLRDFGAFCKPRAGATTIRDLKELRVTRFLDNIEVYLVADAFCHNMVRSLVGALIKVGQGKLSVEELSKIQLAGRRESKFKVISAHGLALTSIDYPANELLGAQAEKTRRRRSVEEISV